MARIFQVEYLYDGYSNGKKEGTFKGSRKVVAKHAEDAIAKVKKIATKKGFYIDDETKKKVITEDKNIEAFEVSLLAETD